MGTEMASKIFTFVGGLTGVWRVIRADAVVGEPLQQAPRVEIINTDVVTLIHLIGSDCIAISAECCRSPTPAASLA
ncbi:MAG: hypothetical protein ACREV4_16340 [Gammaproteobacteria bacterium]